MGSKDDPIQDRNSSTGIRVAEDFGAAARKSCCFKDRSKYGKHTFKRSFYESPFRRDNEGSAGPEHDWFSFAVALWWSDGSIRQENPLLEVALASDVSPGAVLILPPAGGRGVGYMEMIWFEKSFFVEIF